MSAGTPTGRKWGTRREPLSRMDRLRYWWRNVWHSITELPPDYHVVDVLYNPGDPGYDDPMLLSEYVTAYPLRWDGPEPKPSDYVGEGKHSINLQTGVIK